MVNYNEEYVKMKTKENEKLLEIIKFHDKRYTLMDIVRHSLGNNRNQVIK
ncbi:hypothetical protein [Methanocaldococcus jannaschii]|nr:hypothetical protein [Methanocaldococcus jannaschii]